LKLCRASVEMDGSPFSEAQKPKRGDFVEARGRGQRGENLGEVQGQERIDRRPSGNTVFVGTDFPTARTLGAVAA
jgi:hypothetical protein